MKTKGKIILAGAGPGDPGLLTVKGARCLQEAEVVFGAAWNGRKYSIKSATALRAFVRVAPDVTTLAAGELVKVALFD
mgnify:CR=1 FL=1